ncbi:MAG: glycerol kinase GlpK [Clostridia bacterium]
MRKYFVSLDQGTTSSRAIVYDADGNTLAKAQEEFRQIYPVAGWVEHNPQDIWNTQLDVLKEAVAKAGLLMTEITAIGITNQRETTVVWDKESGKAVCNAIVWQCRRTADICEELKNQGLANLVFEKTGLPIDAYFSGTKIKWILDNVDGAKKLAAQGKLLFGTIDTFLMWKLSGGKIHATDYTNASRTMMYNIKDLCWDKQLVQLLGVPENMLPTVCPSAHLFGYTDKDVVGAEIPITGVAGDQQAALFGHVCTEEGCGKNTYGTGCFTLVNTGEHFVNSKRGLITTLCASQQNGRPQYALEGSVFVGGAVLQWLRDEMKIISSAREADEISERTTDTNGVYIVPAFVGLGAPHWDAKARGTVSGLTRGATREHFVRAALESIAYQVFDVAHAMEVDLGHKILSLNVDGGACVSNVLMQFQADILNTNVVRPSNIETTALGAFYLAALGCGMWKSIDEIKQKCSINKIFSPAMADEQRGKKIMGWLEAVARAKYQ